MYFTSLTYSSIIYSLTYLTLPYLPLSILLTLATQVPAVWPESGFVRCLKARKTGYFLYFRASRECVDKHLNKIKIYWYE